MFEPTIFEKESTDTREVVTTETNPRDNEAMEGEP